MVKHKILRIYIFIFYSFLLHYTHYCHLYQPWEKRLRKADEEGTLVYLENLDPSYTSPEVEVLDISP